MGFSCERKVRMYRCTADDGASIKAFRELQQTIRDLSNRLSQSGTIGVPPAVQTLEIDGRIGPTTVLGTQFVVAAFSFSGAIQTPPEVASILDKTADAEEITRRVAASAEKVTAWLRAAAEDPRAFMPKTITVTEPPKQLSSKGVLLVVLAAISVVATGAGLIYSWSQTGQDMIPPQ